MKSLLEDLKQIMIARLYAEFMLVYWVAFDAEYNPMAFGYLRRLKCFLRKVQRYIIDDLKDFEKLEAQKDALYRENPFFGRDLGDDEIKMEGRYCDISEDFKSSWLLAIIELRDKARDEGEFDELFKDVFEYTKELSKNGAMYQQLKAKYWPEVVEEAEKAMELLDEKEHNKKKEYAEARAEAEAEARAKAETVEERKRKKDLAERKIESIKMENEAKERKERRARIRDKIETGQCLTAADKEELAIWQEEDERKAEFEHRNAQAEFERNNRVRFKSAKEIESEERIREYERERIRREREMW